ncbi:hypothetical protein NLX71_11400 [Paenibacillus sp. MZ04-78.2]|uniref:hypothetical protein n=1 Tax=Paenibacillus sp. MZ04-78.2 TaxID=2962034 RepID=UPI0020B8CDE4|nr:hypothetical protein [Paenibacillus sp. MZ04-78.2]MCP3773905.1 hypothetical protein [Paenibacillus sp. MZ04-78.2]
MMNSNQQWKKTALSVVLTASLLGTASISPAMAASEAAAVADASKSASGTIAGTPKLQSYTLADKLQVEIKSLLNETTSEGTRIAAVVRVRSLDAKVAKIPDLELRVKTADGYEYPMQASVFNAHAVRPGTTEELNFFVKVDRRSPSELAELVWYAIDWYSYPKKETVRLAVPVKGQEWTGPLSGFAKASSSVLSWERSFTLSPTLESPLVYTPVSVSRDNTPQGPVTTVKMRVDNPSATKEAVPDITLDGKSNGNGSTDKTVFPGKRVEASPLVLEPKEQRYIHFAIPTDKDTVLTSFNVLTPETFRQLDPKGQPSPVSYSVGRYQVALPVTSSTTEYNAAKPYELGQPFAFDSLSDTIDPRLSVSMVEFHRHENDGEGYQTVIAKLLLRNNSDLPVPVPTFQTKLITAQGMTYSGNRQAGTIAEIMPQTSYAVSYAFNMPTENEDEQYVLKFTDAKTAAPASTAIGAYRVAMQETKLDLKNMSFYPFNVKLNDWTLNARYIVPSALSPNTPIGYTYRMKLDMDITRNEHVVVDPNSSKMQLELVDKTGKSLSTKSLPFSGVNRLISGVQFVQFDALRTEEHEYPLDINIYEVIATPTGEAKRLVGVLKQ